MIKTLAGSLRENKKGSVKTVLLSILEAAFEILIPLCMAKVIDEGIEPENMNAVWRYGLILLVLAAFQLLTGVLCAHTAARAAVGFSANLRQDMYDNIQTFAFSNIDKFSTASIVTRLTTEVTNIQNAYQMLIRMAVRGPVMLAFSMIVSFRINRTIAWIFLAVIPAMAVLLLLIIKRVNPIFNRVFHTYDELNNVVQENVRGIRVVKSFNREDYEISKFKSISKRIYEEVFYAGSVLLRQGRRDHRLSHQGRAFSDPDHPGHTDGIPVSAAGAANVCSQRDWHYRGQSLQRGQLLREFFF